MYCYYNMNKILKSKNQDFNHKYRIVGRVGTDSLFTVLPKSIIRSLEIKQGDLLRIHQESYKIIIEKADN